eukprot:6199988-Pleurochrysis_carterae.AAC.6
MPTPRAKAPPPLRPLPPRRHQLAVSRRRRRRRLRAPSTAGQAHESSATAYSMIRARSDSLQPQLRRLRQRFIFVR